jgi:hypothetical protein
VIAASRRALAGFVLVVAGWLVAWIAAFKVGHPLYEGGKAVSPAFLAKYYHGCAVGTDYCIAVRPGWTIPAAIAIACLGIAIASLLYRGRPNWPRHPRAKPPQAGVFELPPP